MSNLPRLTIRKAGKATGIKKSSFLVTINPNIRPTSLDHATKISDCLGKAVQKLLTHESLKQIITFLTPGHYYSTKYILDIKADFVIELGQKAKGRRVHAHVYLKIKHLSKIRLAPRTIKSIVKTAMEPDCIANPYINIKAIAHDQNLLEYLRKQANKFGWATIITKKG